MAFYKFQKVKLERLITSQNYDRRYNPIYIRTYFTVLKKSMFSK